MASKQTPKYTMEIADLIASNPSREEILEFHPSKPVQLRARKLLEKLRSNSLTDEEEWELDQFEHAEMLMQLVKAKLRTTQKTVS